MFCSVPVRSTGPTEQSIYNFCLLFYRCYCPPDCNNTREKYCEPFPRIFMAFYYMSTKTLDLINQLDHIFYCISRNFRRKTFSQIWLRQTFREFLFSQLSKGVANLHRVDQWVSLPLSPNNHHRHTSSMKRSLEMALRPVSFNLQVRNIHVLHH